MFLYNVLGPVVLFWPHCPFGHIVFFYPIVLSRHQQKGADMSPHCGEHAGKRLKNEPFKI